MKVRVKIQNILEERNDSTVFLIFGRKLVFQNGTFKKGKRNSIIVERELAEKNRLFWKLLLHIPPHINPKYNQTCMNELRFRPEESY